MRLGQTDGRSTGHYALLGIAAALLLAAGFMHAKQETPSRRRRSRRKGPGYYLSAERV